MQSGLSRISPDNRKPARSGWPDRISVHPSYVRSRLCYISSPLLQHYRKLRHCFHSSNVNVVPIPASTAVSVIKINLITAVLPRAVTAIVPSNPIPLQLSTLCNLGFPSTFFSLPVYCTVFFSNFVADSNDFVISQLLLLMMFAN